MKNNFIKYFLIVIAVVTVAGMFVNRENCPIARSFLMSRQNAHFTNPANLVASANSEKETQGDHEKSADPLCGPKSLLKIYEIMKAKNAKEISLEEICGMSGYDNESGTTMLGLYSTADELGLPVIPLNLTLDKLVSLKSPAIAFVDGNHFLVVHGFEGKDILLQNPPKQVFRESKERFAKQWKGQTLVFSKEIREQFGPELSALMQPSGPGIRFNRNNYDFKKVPEGEKISYTFSFANTGKETLQVSARSSCTCTAALLSGNRILPGKKGEIRVEFNTQGLIGPVEQSVYVRTNDANNKFVILSVKANVEPSIKVIPDRIWVDNVVAGGSTIRTIELLYGPDTRMNIKKIETPDGIDAEVVVGGEKDSRFRRAGVEITGGESAEIAEKKGTPLTKKEEGGTFASTVVRLVITSERPGNFDKKVVIHTGNPSRPRIEVPVAGNVLTELNAIPPVFNFGEVSAGKPQMREITLQDNREMKTALDTINPETRFDISSIIAKTEVKGITFRIEKIGDGSGEYKIIAKLEPQKTAGIIKENVSLYTVEGGDPVLNIPLFAVIK